MWASMMTQYAAAILALQNDRCSLWKERSSLLWHLTSKRYNQGHLLCDTPLISDGWIMPPSKFATELSILHCEVVRRCVQ